MPSVDLLLSLVLALIMLGIGASLRIKDFNYVVMNPKALFWGLILQMLFLPLIALLIVSMSNLNPFLCVGLFIVSLCPGGTTSNFISYIIKAEVALSIAMTSINSFLILISIPFLSNFAMGRFLESDKIISLPIKETILQIFLIILIPVIIGLACRHFFEEFVVKLQRPLKYINVTLLALVFSVKFFAKSENGGSGINTDDIFLILPYALLIHLVSMLSSYLLSRKMNLNNRESVTIGIEVGLQNTALALLITGTLIGNTEMTKPALVYAMFSFFTTLIFSLLASRAKERKLKFH